MSEKLKKLYNDIVSNRTKLFIAMIIPVGIISIILFILEFYIVEEIPYLALAGFALLIGTGSFTYFSSTKKVLEENNKKPGIRGFFIYMIPNIIISTLLFTLVSPPEPPFLLVFGLIAYCVAFTAVFFMAVKAVYNSIE